MSAAYSAVIPNARAKGNTQLSFGMGVYRGQAGFAAGLFHYFAKGNLLLNVGAATTTEGETSLRAGFTIGW